MTINGVIIGEVKNFKYLGSNIQSDEGFVVDVKHRIKWIRLNEIERSIEHFTT